MKALIAMSGGVDSSVAARLTKDAGYECIGCTMKLFDNGDAGAAPPEPDRSPDGVQDARSVAARLGMPFYVFDYEEEFLRRVVDRFVESYACGRTPNPCIDCNRYLKFGELLMQAKQLGCDYIVTGHYARIEFDQGSGRYLLKKGIDPKKDQSYVLYNLTQEQLAHVLLPLGALTKPEVRALAEKNGFVNANKPESQDICFVPDGDYAAMIERYSGRTFPPGDFTDLDGNVIGTHKGLIHYTIGQHKRLGQAFGRPRYVCSIDAEGNRIALGGPDDVYAAEAEAADFNWISGEPPKGEIRCKVRLRYKQQEQWTIARDCGGGRVRLRFEEPQRAVTPGQSAVLYDGDIVLGGGVILK